MIELFILVDNPADVAAVGYTEIRIYSDVSASGLFATLVGTVPLNGVDPSYHYLHTAGTAATWYKTSYYGLTPGESDKSAARLGNTSSAYASVDELKANITKVQKVSDVVLQALLDAASENINRICNRPDGFVASALSARLFTGDGGAVQRIDECTAVSLIEVKAGATDLTYDIWTALDWVLFAGDPRRPNLNHPPFNQLMISGLGTFSIFTSGRFSGSRGFRPDWDELSGRGLPTVRVTATWGFAAVVPPVIKTACIAQASRWFKRSESAWADTAASAELGTLLFTKKLDPDIETMIKGSRYIRPPTGIR